MNARALLVALVALVAGTAIGWFAKPATVGQHVVEAVATAANAPAENLRETKSAASDNALQKQIDDQKRELESVRAILAGERKKNAQLEEQLNKPVVPTAAPAKPVTRAAPLPKEVIDALKNNYFYRRPQEDAFLPFIRQQGLTYEQGNALIALADRWKNCQASTTGRYVAASANRSCEETTAALTAMLGNDGMAALGTYVGTLPQRRFAANLATFAVREGHPLDDDRTERIVAGLAASGIDLEKIEEFNMLNVELKSDSDVNAAIKAALAKASADFDRIADATRPTMHADDYALLDRYLGADIAGLESAATNITFYKAQIPGDASATVRAAISADGNSTSISTTGGTGSTFRSKSSGPYGYSRTNSAGFNDSFISNFFNNSGQTRAGGTR